MAVSFEPLDRSRWRDLETVMGGCANGRNCWCAYWYLSAAQYKAGWGPDNAAVLKGIVEAGRNPGLVGYVDGEPAAWVSVAPRTDFDRLNRSTNFAPVDDVPVWAINCFVVAKGYRRQGLMAQMADAAAQFAFARGAPGVEGYPVDPGPKTSAADLYLGSVRAFEAAGFREVRRPLPRRAIMRRMREQAHRAARQ